MNCALYCDKTCVMFAIIQEECRLFSKFTLSLPVEPYTNFQQGFRVFPQAQIPREKIASVELLVFRQDSKDGIFWPSDLVALNKDNPTAPRYSILDELDDFRATDGHFHFKMCYPGTWEIARTLERLIKLFLLFLELHNSSCYRWSQSENPLTIVGQTVPKDFMYKEGPFPITQHFKGLSRSTPYFCILDADLAFPGLWWFPIGTYAEFASPNTFPGPMDKIVSLVELFLEL